MPDPLAPPATPVDVDVTPWLGTYERASVRMEILAGDDGPRLRATQTGPLAELIADRVEEYPMTAVEPGLFAIREPDTETWLPVSLHTLPTGARYLHTGGRATPKAD